MSAATLARAQEPFFTTKGVGKGTGLGLSMVQGFTAQSGGAMRIRSEPGKGTKVTLWLPRAKESSAAAREETQPSQPAQARSLRVLLVDDDILVSMGAANMLLDLGHSVTEAQSGSHALKPLESDGPFDVVVTDYAMPGMNGFELAPRIKAGHLRLPIVLATGYAELPADRSIEFGHLSKPYTSKDLAAALQKAVSTKPSTTARQVCCKLLHLESAQGAASTFRHHASMAAAGGEHDAVGAVGLSQYERKIMTKKNLASDAGRQLDAFKEASWKSEGGLQKILEADVV
jgi:CheY-like chemotaxis protein